MTTNEGNIVQSRRTRWRALSHVRSPRLSEPGIVSILLVVLMVATAFVAISSAASTRSMTATGVAGISFATSAQSGRTISLKIEASPAQASITVQGLIAAPPNSGVRGFETVFEGKATDDIYQLTSADMLRLDQVADQWTSYLGVATERISTPQVFALVMGNDPSGLYVRQVTVPLTAWQVYSGFSGVLKVPVSFGAVPVMTASQMQKYMTNGTVTAGLPCPDGACTCSITSGGCYKSVATYCQPTSCGYGEIPVAFAQFSGDAYGEIIYTMVSSTSSSLTLGMVAGTGPGVSSPAFSPGATAWSVTAEFQQSWDCYGSCQSSGGEGYIYLDATMDLEEWQYWECFEYNTHLGTCEGFKATNSYVWNTGIVGADVVSGVIQGGAATGYPSYWTSNTPYLSEPTYGSYSGTGNSQPQHTVYSNAFVTAYAKSDYSWISMATDALGFISESLPIVGSIVANLLGAATQGSSSSSLASVEFDGPSGSSVGLSVWTSSSSYNFPNGAGEVPLMAVSVVA